MLTRIRAENVFATLIKTNTIYQTLLELALPENDDQDIIKDEIIVLPAIKS